MFYKIIIFKYILDKLIIIILNNNNNYIIKVNKNTRFLSLFNK